jgi:hypothetical protein
MCICQELDGLVKLEIIGPINAQLGMAYKEELLMLHLNIEGFFRQPFRGTVWSCDRQMNWKT